MKVGARTVTLVDREPLALHCSMSTADLCGLVTGPVPDASAEAKAFYADPSRLRDASERRSNSSEGIVSATMMDWASSTLNDFEVDVVLASEVLYGPNEADPFAQTVAQLLRKGGTLLLSDPVAGRVKSARAAVAEALRRKGAQVTEHPLEASIAGNSWYSQQAAEGISLGSMPPEPTVLLRADFAK